MSPPIENPFLGSYRIERELGVGGMGVVYLAHDLRLNRKVAIKLMRSEVDAAAFVPRFRAEISTMARLDHPNILTLLEAGEAGGAPFYVMAYVEGESLRVRLAREQRLPVETALRIAEQVASALDAAHHEGIVHRDIKPENILLKGDQAKVCDFGIAIAAAPIGAERLTRTGMVIGTRGYMSPEQERGDPTLGPPSDVYALASMTYEMLSGALPPLGEYQPLHLGQPTLPQAVDQAISRGLAMDPRARFQSAGDFAAALRGSKPVGDTVPLAVTEPMALRTKRAWASPVVATTGVVAAIILAWLAVARLLGSAPSLTNKTQVTSSGNVSAPAISKNGKMLAYSVSSCIKAACSYGIELAQIGGSAPVTLSSGFSALYDIEWSPDNQNLLVSGTLSGSYGSYLIPISLRGAPRRVSSLYATFWSNGDSLVSIRALRAQPESWLYISGLDSVTRDSICVPLDGAELGFPITVPNSPWIIVSLRQQSGVEWRVMDRSGHVADRLSLPSFAFSDSDGTASTDALWIEATTPGRAQRAVVRVPFDSRAGHFGPRRDTVYNGTFTTFDVTADGGTFVVDDGTNSDTAWAAGFADALRGNFPESSRVRSSTSGLNLHVSPDGRRLLIGRDIEAASATVGVDWFVTPFGRDSETPLTFATRPLQLHWHDSATLEVSERAASGRIQFALVAAQPGATDRDVFQPPDSAVSAFTALTGGGWAWIPDDGRTIGVHLRGDSSAKRLFLPAWYSYAISLAVAPDSRHVAFLGWKKRDPDSLRLSVMSIPDGRAEPLMTFSPEDASVQGLPDGSFLVYVWNTPQIVSLFRVRGPGLMDSLGTVARPLTQFSISADLRRAAAVYGERRSDAWLYHVARR